MEPPAQPAVPSVLACSKRSASDGADVLSLFTLPTGGDVELDALALIQGAVALTLNVREVHEDVVGALARDEAEALLSVEELHGSSDHSYFLFSMIRLVLVT